MKSGTIGEAHGNAAILGGNSGTTEKGRRLSAMIRDGEDPCLSRSLDTEPGSPLRALEIHQAMGDHKQTIETLGNLLCRLQDRLGPVLSSDDVDSEAPKRFCGSIYNAPLAAEIFTNTNHLRDCIQSVEDLLQRLEV